MSLFVFKSKAGSSVIMLKHHAEALFNIMGLSLQPQGTIEAKYISTVLQKLIKAIDDEVPQLLKDEIMNQCVIGEETNTSTEFNDPNQSTIELHVSLRNRAYPLRKLLEQARAAEQAVYWGF